MILMRLLNPAPQLAFFAAIFFLSQLILRLGFAIFEYNNITIGLLPPIFLLGMVYDFAVLPFFLLPISLLLLVHCDASRWSWRFWLHLSGCFTFVYFLSVLLIAECLFWDEFHNRFNFIAVDYLVYTHEVMGNIRESYNLAVLLPAIAFFAGLLTYLYAKLMPSLLAASDNKPKKFVLLLAIWAFFSFIGVSNKWAEFSENRYANELAKNGVYELFSAYRYNSLDYNKFYIAIDEQTALQNLQKHLLITNANPDQPLLRHISASGKPHNYNIVILTVESLSAEYLAAFGNQQNLTPQINKLATESMLFTRMYATGTRTVYGLGAITLSMPPLPGNSLVRRPHNENLFNIASVLNKRGYENKFIYGGYGYFDNMNYFFANNGFAIVDRAQMTPEEITFANIWGVADEDLYRRVLKEADHSYANGKPFFSMVMSTSNHRPFTYPDGKIDIPSGSGRHGAVKYSDYAIGEFLQQAQQKPWFADTIFVIVADHAADSGGKIAVDPRKHYIPMLIYAPHIIKAAKIDHLCSQIDVAPTLLGLLNISYDSKFYGQDLRLLNPKRAFVSNYQQIGYLNEDGLVIMKPIKEIKLYQHRDYTDFTPQQQEDDGLLLNDAVSYFQTATHWRQWSGDIDSSHANQVSNVQ